MIARLTHWIALAALTAAVAGCSSSHSAALRVSGTPGAAFTARFSAGTFSGTLASDAMAEPATIAEFPDARITCEITKRDPTTELTAEVIRGGRRVFQGKSPAGTTTLRFAEKPGGWHTESE